MNIKKLEIESDILKKNVYKLLDIENINEFKKEESSIIDEHKPYYIQCTVDAGDLKKIHQLEESGFRFVEFRYRKKLDMNRFHKVDELSFYPYYIKLISVEDEFEEARQLINARKADDRFSRDPLIKKELSQNRLQAYLEKSFRRYPDELIYGLYNKYHPGLFAIRTGIMKNKYKILFGQISLKENQDDEKAAYMIDTLIISELIKRDIQFFYTVTSGYNIFEMDVHISGLHYRIESTYAILRKIYN